MSPGTVFTSIHFNCNLQMGPIRKSVCHWQAFLILCNVTLKLFDQFISYKENKVLKIRLTGQYSQHLISLTTF
jgi:hypothetical protein